MLKLSSFVHSSVPLEFSTGVEEKKSHSTSPSTTFPVLFSIPCDMGGGSMSHRGAVGGIAS